MDAGGAFTFLCRFLCFSGIFRVQGKLFPSETVLQDAQAIFEKTMVPQMLCELRSYVIYLNYLSKNAMINKNNGGVLYPKFKK